MNGRFLFGKTKRKWGFNLVPHSGTSHGKAVFPALEAGTALCTKDSSPLSWHGNVPLWEQKEYPPWLPVPEAGTALCTIMARSKQPSCEMPKSMV